jgi:hypothetical protein
MAANRDDQSRQSETHGAETPRAHGRHEESDVNAWAVGRFGIALVLVCLGAFAVLFGLFRYFQTSITEVQGPERGVAPSQQPPQPRLLSNEPQELNQVRAAEDQTLNSYGWIDQSKGVVRIPIQRAMELVAQRGLPSRPVPGPQSAAAGVSVPTESALGQKMQAVGGPLAPELAAVGGTENQAK